MSIRCCHVGAALAWLPIFAFAHGGGAASALPESPGLLVSATVATAYLDLDERVLPSQALRGFVVQGDPGEAIDGVNLEHATVDLAYRFSEHLGVQYAVGQHYSDPLETQVARIQMGFRDDHNNRWSLSLGRQRPELGQVLTAAGHFDRFGLVPLAKAAIVNGDWVDDGAELAWQHQHGQSTFKTHLGLWQGRAFPGARDHAGLAPSVHLSVAQPGLVLDAFYAALRPQGRGARVANAPGGHTHVSPRCDAALTEVVCFSGDTHLAGLSGQWQAAMWPLTVSAAAWWREDDGALFSRNGTVAYQGDTYGGWLDALWQFSPRVDAGVRVERLEASHTLSGVGAALLVNEAGLLAYEPAYRSSATVGVQVHPSVQLRVEAGNESVANVDTGYILARVILSVSQLFFAKSPSAH
ncbi:hypothetical protein DFR26_1297 [Paraperlucidibaca baekdonensis]|uniref:Uncharacterized protein n=1 Tax=Paraperlucidibaca baekdonensis TaxID=748120 RepID=A0A3E0H780_9GAMM|nr:hypothetical protein DFR26_1297 [Paraperlucidibaca baekdonensis]